MKRFYRWETTVSTLQERLPRWNRKRNQSPIEFSSKCQCVVTIFTLSPSSNMQISPPAAYMYMYQDDRVAENQVEKRLHVQSGLHRCSTSTVQVQAAGRDVDSAYA